MKFNLFILFFFFNIFLFTPRDCQVGATTQCVNPKGVAVDWWSILKLPVVPDAPNFSAQKLGVSYVYLDSTAPNAWQFDPSLELNGTANALSQTLAPVYASSSLGYLMYNDQDPATGTVHSSFGHTKGVWGFDSSTGFWLTHSVPRFPPSPYTYPDSETQYGQSFLCVSLTTTTINAAAQNLLFNKPYVFQSQLPDALAPLVPNITAVLAGKWVTGAPYTLTNVITTLAGTSWTTFAKNANWDNLLWSALVAPSLPSSLFVETWMNGNGGKINSTCDVKYIIEDVSQVSVAGYSWINAKDHSKWGVSTGSSPHWTCIGDINRVESQSDRGGGCLCLNNGVFAKTFQSIVQSFWPC